MSAAEIDGENDGSFEIGLKMAAAACPDCGELSEPGRCPSCGGEVTSSEEVAEIARARQQALGPLLEQARELQTRLFELPDPTVPVSSDQFAGCIEQAAIEERIETAELFGQRVAALDLDEKAAVGGTVRSTLGTELEDVRELCSVCAELSRFSPSGPAATLREQLIAATARVVEMFVRLLEAITASTIPEVRASQELLQEAIYSTSPLPENLAVYLHRLSEPDLDARIALVIGRPGPYTDPYGFIDPGRVFGAFAEEGHSYVHLADCARAYFAHLGLAEIPVAGAALLILPAVTLASLDRPLLAHRSATQMANLVAGAADCNREVAAAVVARTSKESQRIFAATSRVQKGMRLLYRAAEIEDVDEELLLREVMFGYQELSESAFRAFGWAVLGLQAILEGEEVSLEEEPPMLGSLEQRLTASSSALARSLGTAVDRELRNACGHSQYRWDAETEEVEYLKTGRRWNIDELATATEALGNAVVGVDAGFCCGVLAAEIETGTPATPEITAVLSEANFAVAGYELTALDQKGADATVAGVDRSDLTPLMTALASQSLLAPGAEAYRAIEDGSGKVLLDLSAEQMTAATSAPPQRQDLAIINSFFDSALRTGRPTREAARESLVVQTKVLAMSALRTLALEGAEPELVSTIRARSELVRSFAQGHPEIGEPLRGSATGRLERLIAETYRLEHGETKALERTLRRINAVFRWAEEQGVRWPPSAPAHEDYEPGQV